MVFPRAVWRMMNYAALLALLVVLSFALPFVVRIAESFGVPAGLGFGTVFIVALFFIGWAVIRWRVKKRQLVEARIARVVKNKAALPDDTQAFYDEGDHVADLLIALGRYREALAEYEAHVLVAERNAKDSTLLRQRLDKLKKEYPL